MTATVTCVGIAVQDFVFGLDSSVDLGHKNFASSFCVVGGGPAANAAVAIAALGGRSRLVARLGSDTVGDSIIAGLEMLEVDVSRVRRVPDTASPLSTVIVDDRGERTIVNHTDDRLFGGSDTVATQDIIDSQALLVDLRWSEGALTAIRLANRLGIPSVVDFDLTTSVSHGHIIESATHLIFSEPALLALTGNTDIAQALASISGATDAFVGVTLGREGFRWLDTGTFMAFPGFNVDVVDTLGAGDVFHGAFALGLAEGRALDEIIRWASAAAALKCTRRSTMEGFPTRREVATLMEEVKP
jgi:sulfofructose kinase